MQRSDDSNGSLLLDEVNDALMVVNGQFLNPAEAGIVAKSGPIDTGDDNIPVETGNVMGQMRRCTTHQQRLRHQNLLQRKKERNVDR